MVNTDMAALMPPKALAARWHTSAAHLANLRSGGRGPAFVRIGTRIHYRTSDVLAYEQANRVSTLDAA